MNKQRLSLFTSIVSIVTLLVVLLTSHLWPADKQILIGAVIFAVLTIIFFVVEFLDHRQANSSKK